MKVRRYQSGKPSIEAGQTIKWSKEKREKVKKLSTTDQLNTDEGFGF